MDPLVFHATLRSTLKMGLSLLFFWGMGLYLLLAPSLDQVMPGMPLLYVSRKFSVPAGILSLLLALGLTLLWGHATFRPVVVLDEEGIHDIRGGVVIPWGDVKGVTCQDATQTVVLQVPQRYQYLNQPVYTLHLDALASADFQEVCRALVRR